MKLYNITIIGLLIILTHSLYAQSLYTSVSYNTSLTIGETNDFISQYSWRGIGIEGNWFMNDNMSLGVNTGWNIFYEQITGVFEDDTKSLSGTQQRTINAFPILVDYRIHLKEPYATRPYFGLGIGTYWINKQTEMGVYYKRYRQLQFGLAPVIGILIPVGQVYLNPSLRYNIAFKTKDNYTMDVSYLGINLGIAWAD